MESTKPKILILTDWFVPGYKAGGPIKSVYNMVRLMCGEFDFRVLTRNTDWEDSIPYELEADKWLNESNFQVKYLSKKYLSAVFAEIRNAPESTTLFFNGVYSPVFNALPLIYLLTLNKKCSIIVSARGMLNANAIALKSEKKRILISVYRMLDIERKVLFHAASEAEQQAIKLVFSKAQIVLARNIPEPVSDHRTSFSTKNRNLFLSVARISPVKNTLFLIEQLGDLESLTLELIGSSDDESYFQLCKETTRKAKAEILFRGALSPSELTDWYSKAGYGIFPTTGENFGHAIIEALAHGTPVIISDQTPWNDVEKFGAGWVISLDDPERWKETIKLATEISDANYAQMSGRAMEYVRGKFDFDDIRKQYLNLFSAANRSQ
ncbi:MAG: glycosyltransferase family 4 protein [Flavobacteriales bacterium]